MSGYIARAACRGRRPSSLAALDVRERPRLLRLLLRERGVARFIVAPGGYGKTSLAVSYAETITSWVHTFWLNAQSPCFLRDLDQGIISSTCLDLDPEAKLVVFDDVPALDAGRARRLSETIDHLIDRDCEVVITCVPMCDTVGQYQIDRVKISARDLLLDDDEVDGSRTADERSRMPVGSLGAAHRVPGVEWAKPDGGIDSFARAVFSEELAPDVALVTASVLVLCEGDLSDLQQLCPSCGTALDEMRGDYPHLGLDADRGRFEAPGIPAAVLAPPVKKLLTEFLAWSSFEREEQLVAAWASILLRDGQPDRACEVVGELCPRRARAGWLIPNAYELVRQGCFLSMFRLAEDRECQKGAMRMRLGAIEVLCRRVLGDVEGAVKLARRRAFDVEAPHDVRTLSALVVARYGHGRDAERALSTLAAEALLADKAPVDGPPWPFLAKAWCVHTQGPQELLECWAGFRSAKVSSLVLDVSAAWLFGLLGDGAASTFEISSAAALLRECESYVRQRLAEEQTPRCDYYVASAGLSLEEARTRGLALKDGPLPAGAIMSLRQVEMSVVEQRQGFADNLHARARRRGDWAASHRDYLFNQSYGPMYVEERRTVPVLSIRTFGVFEVMIGDKRVEEERFQRRNTRVMLALLAANEGREVVRDSLSRSMWPQSAEEVARKNFYSAWSLLRSAITLPDGTCPYLVRHRYGCSLDARYVKSDIDRFNEICRELLFGVPNYDRWTSIFAEIDGPFSKEFMPAETRNGLIVRAREEYRSRLVDALVGATFSIVDTETPQWAIWFARTALRHDETREDAYVALMRAQIASNQRTAAMMTFLKCRRVLRERLGIDPSPEVVRLYESLLGDA